MRSVTLVAHEDEHGVKGLIIDGMMRNGDVNSCNEGLLVAHDIIEHVNGPSRIGDIADELEALGAIWICRGQWGDLRRDGVGSVHRAEKHIASDVTRMARDVACGAYWWPGRLRTRSCNYDDVFEEVLEIAKADLSGELDDSDITHEDALASYWQSVIPLMRIGARKLIRKFGNRYTSNTIFWHIAEACDRACKHVEGYERYHLFYDISGAALRELTYDGY